MYISAPHLLCYRLGFTLGLSRDLMEGRDWRLDRGGALDPAALTPHKWHRGLWLYSDWKDTLVPKLPLR